MEHLYFKHWSIQFGLIVTQIDSITSILWENWGPMSCIWQMIDSEFKPDNLTPEPPHFIVHSAHSIPEYRHAEIYLFLYW